MKTQETYRQKLNRLANAFPRSISFPYGHSAVTGKPCDCNQGRMFVTCKANTNSPFKWEQVGKNN